MQLQNLAQQLTAHRWHSKYTIAQLSEMSGVDASVIREIESGQLDVDVLTLNEICCALNVTCDELFNDSVNQVSPLNIDLCVIPVQPTTLLESRQARDWYRMKKQQYTWLRSKRAHALQQWRGRRLALTEERAARIKLMLATAKLGGS